VDLSDTERALVWKDNRLAFILGPGRHAFWRSPYELKVETFNVEDFRFTHPRMEAIAAHPDAAKWFEGVEVEAHEDVLLFRNGELVDRLGQGKHLFWKGAGRVKWRSVDRREQIADVAGQEIMTSDKVTLRVNLVVTYQVTDPVKAATVVNDYAQALYREAQLVLRAAVGTRLLDALLADKEAVGTEVRDALVKRVAEFGLVIRSVGLRDIVLPGEMKAILNQVIAAEKQAQANLIKRREETAAARSQANTAKLLAENPILARVKELELLQEMLAGAKATFVFGNGDIAEQVRRLVGQGDAGDG
jgi:regulator of protease activity HflC (stomatin/prohibitin superfamily)